MPMLPTIHLHAHSLSLPPMPHSLPPLPDLLATNLPLWDIYPEVTSLLVPCPPTEVRTSKPPSHRLGMCGGNARCCGGV